MPDHTARSGRIRTDCQRAVDQVRDRPRVPPGQSPAQSLRRQLTRRRRAVLRRAQGRQAARRAQPPGVPPQPELSPTPPLEPEQGEEQEQEQEQEQGSALRPGRGARGAAMQPPPERQSPQEPSPLVQAWQAQSRQGRAPLAQGPERASALVALWRLSSLSRLVRARVQQPGQVQRQPALKCSAPRLPAYRQGPSHQCVTQRSRCPPMRGSPPQRSPTAMLPPASVLAAE
jgi:hypothetical protein